MDRRVAATAAPPAASAEQARASESARVAPHATWSEDVVTALIGFWPLVALYFDGRGHVNEVGQDSFWSVAHIFLYSGLAVFALWILWVVRRRWTGRLDRRVIPVGYSIGVLGLTLAWMAGGLDFIWHAAYGFEANVEAAYSPPHLLLLFGGLCMTSIPIRSAWARADEGSRLRTALPPLLSATLTIGVLGFIWIALSAFMTNVTPIQAFGEEVAGFNEAHTGEIGANTGLTRFDDGAFPYHFYSVNYGFASVLVTTLLLLAPMLYLLRRWRLPVGSFTLVFLAYGVLMSILTEGRDLELLIPLAAAGVVADALHARLDAAPPRAVLLTVGAITPLVLWSVYFAVLELAFGGLGWEPTLWVGAIMAGTGGGVAAAVLLLPPRPPAVPEHR